MSKPLIPFVGYNEDTGRIYVCLATDKRQAQRQFNDAIERSDNNQIRVVRLPKLSQVPAEIEID